jgi:hypothetical protein
MRPLPHRFSGVTVRVSLLVLLGLVFSYAAHAQAVPYARTFPKPKDQVQASLKDLGAYTGQKLPVVDGFVAMGDRSLDRYERAFYQFSIDVLPDSPGSTIVRLTAKITAWYADPDPAKSGYQVLPSNGRLELDFLDRLSEKLGGKPLVLPSGSNTSPSRLRMDALGNVLPNSPSANHIDTPVAMAARIAAPEGTPSEVAALREKRELEEKHMLELKSEVEALQQIRKNQAHPKNLVIVKKAGTPVLARPTEGAKILFTASAEDEFEFIETEGDWFHVQISGVSRGWIRRSQGDSLDPRWNSSPSQTAAEKENVSFHVSHQETSQFPGDWAPLQSKTVQVYWVQPTDAAVNSAGHEKREFAKTIFQQAAKDAGTSPAFSGVVIIFDTTDGGQVSATVPALQQWTENKLTEAQFWQQCSVDPPELFSPTSKR